MTRDVPWAARRRIARSPSSAVLWPTINAGPLRNSGRRIAGAAENRGDRGVVAGPHLDARELKETWGDNYLCYPGVGALVVAKRARSRS